VRRNTYPLRAAIAEKSQAMILCPSRPENARGARPLQIGPLIQTAREVLQPAHKKENEGDDENRSENTADIHKDLR
jgi:hypothetical protein